MIRFIVPRIALRDLPPMLAAALAGALLAGIYGILHDQWTYSISAEYFTNMKFQQFHYADFGLGDRAFAGIVGFLGTWWVGLVFAWFLARRLIPGQPLGRAFRQIGMGFLLVLTAAVLSAALGYAFGLWLGPEADYSRWAEPLNRFHITGAWAFMRVAYIHWASYLGGLAGFLAALVVIRPSDSSGNLKIGRGGV